jgi:hypothetical protein
MGGNRGPSALTELGSSPFWVLNPDAQVIAVQNGEKFV